jgi:hypothetical protein
MVDRDVVQADPAPFSSRRAATLLNRRAKPTPPQAETVL